MKKRVSRSAPSRRLRCDQRSRYVLDVTRAALLFLLLVAAMPAAARPWTKKTAWEQTDAADLPKVFELGAAYIDFLSRAKTEREVVAFAIERARERGFRELAAGAQVAAGDRLLFPLHGQARA